MYKKGRYDIQALAPIAVIFVTTAIVIAFGAKVLSDLSDSLTGTAGAVVDNGTEALSTFGEWLPTLAIVVVAAVIIAVVAGAFFIGRE